MTFRGYFALNGIELANSSRIVAHLGMDIPTTDVLLGGGQNCAPVRQRPNRARDLSDAAAWSGSGVGGANVVRDVSLGFATIKATGNGSANAYVNMARDLTIPASSQAAWTWSTAPGEQWKTRVTVYAAPTNPGGRNVNLSLYTTDSTGVNSALSVPAVAVPIMPGQTVTLTHTGAVPVGRNQIRPVLEEGILPSGYVFHAYDFYVERVADPALVGLYEPPADSVEYLPGLLTPPNGSRQFEPGLFEIDQCWDVSALCTSCKTLVRYDDSWPDLLEFLGDFIYRPELAPWYSTRVPESAEFAGLWVLNVDGLDVTPGSRPVNEAAGSGGIAGAWRDSSRQVKFTVLLMACTNAGLTFGMQWVAEQLRGTNDRRDSVLRYMSAHPQDSDVDPATLVREVHGVVSTSELSVVELQTAGNAPNRQANIARIEFTLTATNPYAFYPPTSFDVDWDLIDVQPIEWVHAAECVTPDYCEDMPVLFSTSCVVEEIPIVTAPPPTCGGCMPVCAVETRSFRLPVFDTPRRGVSTAVTVRIRNTGVESLTLQGFWRTCASNERCNDKRFPVEVSGLPAGAELVLDAISGRFHAIYEQRVHDPRRIVATPNGAPWRPPIIDRSTCWEFVVTAAETAQFEVSMSMADREA